MIVFIAGVMQGNKKKHGIRSQEYREKIAKHLSEILPGVDIVDPDKTDPDRLKYNDEEAAEMFFRYCKVAGKVDFLISYLPEASMGSAVEMWIAHESNIPIVTISPISHNWVVRLLSNMIFPDFESFLKEFNNNSLKELGIL